MALICDTGPLYAVLDRDDARHRACVELLTASREPLLVPAPVVVELDWLAGARRVRSSVGAFLRDVEMGTIRVVDLVGRDYGRIRELLDQYADLELGFVDAAVLAVVERLEERKLVTLDHRHFATVRPKHVAALELLPG